VSLIGEAQEVRRRLFQVIDCPSLIQFIRSSCSSPSRTFPSAHFRDRGTVSCGNLPINYPDLAASKAAGECTLAGSRLSISVLLYHRSNSLRSTRQWAAFHDYCCSARRRRSCSLRFGRNFTLRSDVSKALLVGSHPLELPEAVCQEIKSLLPADLVRVPLADITDCHRPVTADRTGSLGSPGTGIRSAVPRCPSRHCGTGPAGP
jgi:hypothetical protein